jgi:2-keto-4-pentenoate hydratase
VRDLLGSSDVALAYAVQEAVNTRRVLAGARVVGRKIGLTSTVVQRQLGVDQPDFGVLFHDMAHASADVVPMASLLQPKVEAEVAFVLSEDLDGDLDDRRLRASVDCIVAALEIVDSRITGWDITIVDTVADNGSSGLFVLGDRPARLVDVEPRDVSMSMTIDGATVSEGNGRACLGDPLIALAWLARTAQEHGVPLRAGEVVLSGALGPMVSAAPGNHVRADISGLGSVWIEFAPDR